MRKYHLHFIAGVLTVLVSAQSFASSTCSVQAAGNSCASETSNCTEYYVLEDNVKYQCNTISDSHVGGYCSSKNNSEETVQCPTS